MPTDIKREVPAMACHLAGGEVTFAAAKSSGNTPIRMFARSALPVEHWWWGRVVHDMSGMHVSKKSIPIDYEHYEPIGFLDKFDASNKGLFVEGELVPTGEPGDVTSRLLKLANGGVPYEASINFEGDGIKVEWLGEDQVAEVNGYTFEGPGVIVREWPLRGVAVCPYGVDANTESRFERDSKLNFKLQEANMPTQPATKLSETAPDAEVKPGTEAPAAATAEVNQETTPAAAPAASQAPAADALSAVRTEMNRFRQAFGEKGPGYFADGLSFEAAAASHIKELVDANAKLTATNADLAKKLSEATGQQQGELSAVGFQAIDDKKSSSRLSGRIAVARTVRKAVVEATK